jgi:hypothetical protein
MQQMNYWWAKWKAPIFFSNIHQFSLLLSTKQTMGSHQTSQNTATLYCFSLFSFQQTNKGIHLPHTLLDWGPTNSQAHITQLEIFYLFISLSVE